MASLALEAELRAFTGRFKRGFQFEHVRPVSNRKSRSGSLVQRRLCLVNPGRFTPARGPQLRDEYDAQAAEGVEPVPDWDEAAQAAPDFEVDQRVSW